MCMPILGSLLMCVKMPSQRLVVRETLICAHAEQGSVPDLLTMQTLVHYTYRLHFFDSIEQASELILSLIHAGSHLKKK